MKKTSRILAAICSAAVAVSALSMSVSAAEIVWFEGSQDLENYGNIGNENLPGMDFTQFVPGSRICVTFTGDETPWISLLSEEEVHTPLADYESPNWGSANASSVENGVAYYTYEDVLAQWAAYADKISVTNFDQVSGVFVQASGPAKINVTKVTLETDAAAPVEESQPESSTEPSAESSVETSTESSVAETQPESSTATTSSAPATGDAGIALAVLALAAAGAVAVVAKKTVK
ncbi:MAG TPA: hypothetical protein H9671_08515 [Firmicutes bacterium]|nr:hypothetical protein [Bacillota bacterium]